MRGNEWNRLVGEPSVTDVEAALADVRIRAVPIARRNARNRRALSVLVSVLLVGGAFWAGGLSAANGVQVGLIEEPNAGNWNAWTGHPVLEAAPGPVAARTTSSGPSLRRFHVTSWTEWYGERFGEDEAWVEGPPGTSFAFGFGLPGGLGAAGVRGEVRVHVSGDSVGYLFAAQLRSLFGATARGLALYEEGASFERLTVVRGQAVTYYPLGRRGGDEPVIVARIEGPDAAPPSSPIRWDSVTAFNEDWLRVSGVSNREELTAARARGVRFGKRRVGSLMLLPLFHAPPTPMRMSVVGRSDHGRFTVSPWAQRVIVPGIRDTLRVVLRESASGTELNCFVAMRNYWRPAQADRDSGQQPFRATGCFPRADPWAPIEVTANNGQRLRVQLIKVPDLNY